MSAFDDVTVGARGHLGLLFYAAGFHLIWDLKCRAETVGRTLEDVAADFPFLGTYFDQIRRRAPEGMAWGDTARWLSAEIEQWQSSASETLPLLDMQRALGLPFPSVLAFALVGTVEEVAQFGALFASLQQGERRVTVGLLQQVFETDEGLESWETIKPLIDAGFMQVANPEAPRASWVLRIPAHVWTAARGDVAEHPLPGLRHTAAAKLEPLEDLAMADDIRSQVAGLRALVAAGRTRAIIVRGMPGTERVATVGGLAKALGRGLIEVDCPAPEERIRGLGPLCTLGRAIPLFRVDAAPGETFEIPRLPGYEGPMAVVIGREGGVGGAAAEHAITIRLELESPAERLALWTRALNGHAAAGLGEIASSVCLPGRYIRQCASLATDYAALERRGHVNLEDVRQAARALNRQVLDTLASRIESPAGWRHLILRQTTQDDLLLLTGRCRHREHLADSLTGSIPGGLNRGVRALFEGASGTGKTLAARVVAGELGMDLYRVDLASVVNKYIGETEKNLSRVLSRAEDLNVILLLDEGDALMTRRTDVKTSNDRYANLETNYLLQRLETYTGIIFITTNAGHSIDSAFRRRMDAVVKFHLPDAAERRRLWQAHLSRDHAVPGYVLDEIAERYPLAGGQIRNVAVHAALLAVERQSARAGTAEVREAIQAEHRKAGDSFHEPGPAPPARNDSTLAAFLGGLS